ncbi:MAG TPA: hypothetical protein VEA58_05065 [Anaerovoracaceae bacterium]|nr:hypothetical protein [Anaerovoracaceae bacterium]
MVGPIMFAGPVQVYVEGKGALYPFQWDNDNEIIYYVGSSSSNYKIIDWRNEVNQMAADAINNLGEWSPQIFCSPSHVKITKEQNGLTILLENCSIDVSNGRILWLGTMEGEELQANPVLWLQYQDIEDGRAAFVGIVDPSLTMLPTK